MVDGSGLDLIQEIKIDPELSSIPIIFIATSTNKSSFKEQYYSLGINAFLTAPIDIDATKLYSTIAPYLREREKERPPDTPE